MASTTRRSTNNHLKNKFETNIYWSRHTSNDEMRSYGTSICIERRHYSWDFECNICIIRRISGAQKEPTAYMVWYSNRGNPAGAWSYLIRIKQLFASGFGFEVVEVSQSASFTAHVSATWMTQVTKYKLSLTFITMFLNRPRVTCYLKRVSCVDVYWKRRIQNRGPRTRALARHLFSYMHELGA